MQAALEAEEAEREAARLRRKVRCVAAACVGGVPLLLLRRRRRRRR